jgi:hypothetical protein
MNDLNFSADMFIQENKVNYTHKPALRLALTGLSDRHRLAFAVCCAERSLPYYQEDVERYPVAAQFLRQTLDRLWEHLCDHLMEGAEIDYYASAVESILDVNPGWEVMGGVALHGIGTLLCSVWTCRDQSLDHSVDAGMGSAGALEQLLLNRETGPGDYISQSPAEDLAMVKRVTNDPLMVGELRKQAEVVLFLYEHKELTESAIAKLRQI